MPALFASYSGALGGGERLLLDAALGPERPPVVACPDGPLAQAAREAGLPVLLVAERTLEIRASRRDAARHAAGLAGMAADVRRLARDLAAPVVVAWGMRAALAAAAGLPRATPWVFQHNDLLPALPAAAGGVRTAARRARAVVALSHAVAADLGLPGVRVIHPGVDLERFAAAAPDPGAGAEVLLLGVLEPWKRPDLALEIVARTPGVHLTVAGAPLGREGERLAAALRARSGAADLAGRVTFAGRLADPRGALRRAGALLHCADAEPFGIVLIEALATGRPVVAPDAFGPREIVDPTCGRLYRPGDPAAGAAALAAVLSDAGGLAAPARARAQERFDVRATRAAYRAILEPLSASPTARRSPRRPEGRAAEAPAPVAAPPLAFVTVAHDSAADLRRFLRSVARAHPRAHVVVVDSGSRDDSAAVARAHGAEVLELPENVGFGQGVNAGVARLDGAATPVAVLANPDLELVDDSLATLAAAAATGPSRLLVPAVLLRDGRRQDVAQHAPGSLAAAVIAAAPPAALPPAARAALQPWTAHEPRPAAWPVGACVVARTDTLSGLGPFDPSLFLYGEDLDLGLRARARGVRTWFDPRARVIHHQGHSSGRAFGGEPFERLARQRRTVVAGRLGPRTARRDDVLQAATFANRIALKGLLRRPAERERRQLAALWRAARGARGARS